MVRLTADRVVTWSETNKPASVAVEKVYLGPNPLGKVETSQPSAVLSRALPNLGPSGSAHATRTVTW